MRRGESGHFPCHSLDQCHFFLCCAIYGPQACFSFLPGSFTNSLRLRSLGTSVILPQNIPQKQCQRRRKAEEIPGLPPAGTYHSRPCLPRGARWARYTPHAIAATLLDSCCIGCVPSRCKSHRLGGRACILPTLGLHRSQGHNPAHSCHLWTIRGTNMKEGLWPAGFLALCKARY